MSCGPDGRLRSDGSDGRERASARGLALGGAADPVPAGDEFAARFPVTPDEIVPYRTVGETVLDLHVFRPAPGPDRPDRGFPAVVFFFGGGWEHGSPVQFHRFARYLASRGMVALAADYRTKEKHGTDPFACVADAKAALRWVRAHASGLHVDPDRIAAGGGSAGGHLAAATAFLAGFEDAADATAGSCRPDALILYNPVVDNGPGGYGFERIGARYREFSILHNLAAARPPPAIVFLGTQDALIPVHVITRFAEALRRAGGRCDTRFYATSGHGFFNWQEWINVRFYETLIATDAFLASLGWIGGDPTLEVPAGARLDPPDGAGRAS